MIGGACGKGRGLATSTVLVHVVTPQVLVVAFLLALDAKTEDAYANLRLEKQSEFL